MSLGLHKLKLRPGKIKRPKLITGMQLMPHYVCKLPIRNNRSTSPLNLNRFES